MCSPDTTGCKNGTYSCATGKQVCVFTGNKSKGTSCGAAQTCSGSAQTPAYVCDGNGQCPTPVSIDCLGNGCNTATNTCNTCSTGFTQCGTGTSTCYDLMSDDKHCGGCSGTGTDCTTTPNYRQYCRAGKCRLMDGLSCTSDSDCFNGKCNMLYADYDGDGYPSHDLLKVQRFCGSSQLNQQYILPRSDGAWDCCDLNSQVHPGATQYVSWGGPSLDMECQNNAGNTDCANGIQTSPVSVVTGCTLGASCVPTTRALGQAECGTLAMNITCRCDDSCTLQCPPNIGLYTVSCL
jgi:hypothetical protein